MKKIAVTGLSGMVGTRFSQLYENDYEMANLNLTNGVDITNRVAVDNFVKESNPEAIIHLAAFTNVSAAHEQEGNRDGSCFQVNVVGTENIARTAKEQGVYLIHISTDFVFDGEKEGIYTEEDEVNPIEWYGKTKWWAEEKVRELADNYVILRIAYPYQAQPVRADFLQNMILKLKDDTLPPAFDNHWVTPTFVDDLAKVFDYCINNQPLGLYHSLGSSWHTDYEMAHLVKQVFDLPGEVIRGDLDEYLAKINRPYQRSLKVSNEKLRREFEIEMKTFEEGLNKVKKQA